jgi:hypothetical protein
LNFSDIRIKIVGNPADLAAGFLESPMTEEINVTNESAIPDYVPEEDQLEEFIDNMNMAEADAESLRSLTRLLVGGALVGWDELLSHLQAWENEIAAAQAQESDAINAPPQDPAATLRFAMIGLLFESQDRLVKGSKKALNLFWQATESFWSPVLNRAGASRQLDPVRNRYDELVRRGEAVTRRWVDRGQNEEARSRQLARTAAQQSFDTSMDQLGQAPALEELIRRQSAGLTQTAMDEARSRTVSGDMVAENLARSILRRVPRRQLHEPLPSEESEPGSSETG